MARRLREKVKLVEKESQTVCVIVEGQTKTKEIEKEQNLFSEKLVKSLILCFVLMLYEPRHEKTGFLHMQKQRRRSLLRS